MEKLTSLNLSFDKILIIYLIPGFAAAFPWFIYVLHFHQETKKFLMGNNSISITIVSCISLVVGLIIENIGSAIELYNYDRRNAKNNADFKECWDKFLQLCYKDEPVGQRYIRTILLRMKFELAMGIGCLSFAIGLRLVETIKPDLFNGCVSKIFSYGLPIALFGYFIFLEGPKKFRSSSKDSPAPCRKIF